MSNKRLSWVTAFRIVFIVIFEAIIYRKVQIEAFLTAVTLIAVCFWVLPHLMTALIFSVFKMKDDFGGTLLFDDEDPTDCRFRMIFEVDPDELRKEPTFIVKCERTTLKQENVVFREQNKH